MSDQHHKTTQDMIVDYYRKDKRRSIATIALAAYAVTIATWGIVTIVNRVNQVHKQVQCIASFFTQNDRQNLKIPSVDDCSIQRVK